MTEGGSSRERPLAMTVAIGRAAGRIWRLGELHDEQWPDQTLFPDEDHARALHERALELVQKWERGEHRVNTGDVVTALRVFADVMDQVIANAEDELGTDSRRSRRMS